MGEGRVGGDRGGVKRINEGWKRMEIGMGMREGHGLEWGGAGVGN